MRAPTSVPPWAGAGFKNFGIYLGQKTLVHPLWYSRVRWVGYDDALCPKLREGSKRRIPCAIPPPVNGSVGPLRMASTTTDLTQPDLSSTAFRSQQVIIVVDCSGSMKPHWSHFKGQYLLPAIQ